MTYTIERTRTCKTRGSKEQYQSWDSDTKHFSSIDEAKDFLQAEYGTCKKEKIYHDKNNESVHTGYIYCYNTPKSSYDDTAKHNQDWISVYKVQSKPIII